MQHRRRTGPAARGRAAAAALGVLLACAGIAGTALAAAGGEDSDPAAAVLQIARQQLGDPYVYGSTGPDSWDCSGLTSRLWREVGGVKDIPRVSRDQQAWAVPIPAEQLLVGDLVFFGNPVTHVALYAGNGTIVDASSSQHKVVERKVWKQADIRYGRVPRPGMPPVTPWTPPSPSPSASPSASPSPSASATAGTTTGASTGKSTTSPTAKPTTKPSPSPTASNETSDSAALTAQPLRGLPARDLPAVTSIAAHAVTNALSVKGSSAWTDVALVQAAWRHAGGGPLPKERADLVAAGTVIPVGAARIGDLVVYGTPASHVGVYLGHGFMVDASPTLGRVVVRRVFSSSTVRIVRLDVG
ncbi:MAG: peptidoglycan DL-endopeptidase CwlO [Actinomycetota bacterium]|nr:peptidoglycan DL-endopeptidase CwlO [Actinomycetota bacterium]